MYKLKEVNIKDFRGYRDEKIKIPEADIILLVGNNGFGKTSFFDAVEWGITGQLKRYESGTNERNAECFLKNKHANQQGYVNIVFEDEEGQEVEIKRTTKEERGNDYNQGLLEIKQDLKESITDILVKRTKEKDFDLNKSFNFSHLLSQELISDFVRNHKETERYSVLSNLIGFKNYDAYSKKLKNLRMKCSKKYEILKEEQGEKEKEAIVLKEKVKNSTSQDGKNLRTKYSTIIMGISLHDSIDNNIFPKDITKMDKRKVLKTLRKEKDNLDKESISCKENLEKIVDLQERKNNYTKWCSQQSNLRKVKEAIDKKSKINYIKKNYDSNLNQKGLEEEYNEITKKIDSLKDMIGIINDKDKKIMEKIKLLIEQKKEVKEQFTIKILILKGLSKDIDNTKEKLNNIEEKIVEVSNIEKKLLAGAHDYFLENSSAERCPVCLNKIEINNIINELKERLEREGGEVIKNYLKQKEKIKSELKDKISERDNLKEKMKNQYVEFKEGVLKEHKVILEEKDNLNEKIKIIKKIKLYLQEFDLEEVRDNILDELKKIEDKNNKVLKDDKYKKYTIAGQDENIELLNDELERINKKISSYQIKLENLEVSNIGELKILFKKYQEKTSRVNYRREKISEIISKLDNIIQSMENSKDNDKLQKIKKEISIIEKKVEFLEEKEKELKEIEKEVPAVINKMTEKILRPYKELANTIYRKINPQPIYRRMDWKIDSTGHNNGTLRLKMYSDDGKEANPSYIYSSAQVNVIVLSLFLSFALQQNWSKLDAIFMDDPVQNMDDINIFCLIDVLRNIVLKESNAKQIFISTHDRKLFNFMKKKFRMLNVFVLEFKGYDKNGAKIDKYIL
ncbi:AAA family ATPase [Natroniella sp. ANB-PHB2]|uniref:AAA family ATPase n=1 Tax=Natroniella sp. ANB-PHB2 TaxID=3384444 RepID=UPI0038D36364